MPLISIEVRRYENNILAHVTILKPYSTQSIGIENIRMSVALLSQNKSW